MRMIDNWKVELHRLWSIRISLFVGILTGIASVINAFDSVFNPWLLVTISVLADTLVIPLARLIDQKDPPA